MPEKEAIQSPLCHTRRESHPSHNPLQKTPIFSRDINDKMDQDGPGADKSNSTLKPGFGIGQTPRRLGAAAPRVGLSRTGLGLQG
jgi:hypothetical protein